MSLFTRISLIVANADQEIFDRCPNGETTIIKAIGWAIVIASVVAGIAFYVFLDSLTGSVLLGMAGAFVMVTIIALFDRSLLRDESKTKLIFRFLFSVAIALFISVPVKVNMAEDSLKTYIVESTARYNQGLRNQVDEVRDEIDFRLEEINNEIIIASERDANGRITQVQRLVELRRLKTELLENREQRIADMEARIAPQVQTPDTSFMAQMGTFIDLTLHPSKANDPIANFLNVVILLLFILTEALPSMLRMTLQNSNYIRAVEFKNKLIKKIQAKIEEIQSLLIESDSFEVNGLLMKRQDYYVKLSKLAASELKTTEELQHLYTEVLRAEEEYTRKLANDHRSGDESEPAVPVSPPSPQQRTGPMNGALDPDVEAPEFTYD